MKLKYIIGMNLKYYRYKMGLSQEKFYSQFGLNPKYLAGVERGEENITIERIEELARLIGVRTEDLINYNENHIIKKKRIDEKEKINLW